LPIKAPRPVKYEPIPVYELLTDMSEYSRLMIDLAYYSVVVNDSSLAYEVQRVEDKLDAAWSLLVMQASLAVKTVRDAEEMVSVYRMANALDKLSDSAADIAMLVLRGTGISEQVRAALLESEEVIARITVRNKAYEGFSIERLYEMMTGFNIIAIRREDHWIINPDEETEIKVGDILIVRGTFDSLSLVAKMLGDEIALKKPVTNVMEEKLAKKIAYLKNISDVMIDLAFHAIVNNDKIAANEVLNLEEAVDELAYKMILYILSEYNGDPEEKAGLMSFVTSMENIADAATELIVPLASNLPIHPIVRRVEEESVEQVAKLKIPENFKERTLESLALDDLGVLVIALYRNNKIIPMPKPDTIVKPGDILLIKYYSGTEANLIEKLEALNIEYEGIEEEEEEEE